MSTNPADNRCTFCSKELRPRQHAFKCECCGRWQHRLCNTDTSLSEYRRLTKLSAVFEWRCCQCSPQSLSPASPLAGSAVSTYSTSPTVSVYPLAESTRFYKQVQAKLEKLWQRYRVREITTGHLLRACSRLYAPIDV